MEGSAARGQSVRNFTALLAALGSAASSGEFCSELNRGIATSLKYIEPLVLLMNPHSGDSSIDRFASPDVSRVIPAWIEAHLERHTELLQRLANGDFIGITHAENDPKNMERRTAILLPVIHGGLLAIIGLVSEAGAVSVTEEELEDARQIAHYAGPLLARIQEIELLRAGIKGEKDSRDYSTQMLSHLHSNFAHEFRTPLATIRGYTRMILDRRTGDLSPTQRDYLTTIGENTNRLIDLVSWLSHVTALGSQYLQLGDADLKEIWLECRGMQMPSIMGKSLRLKERIPEGAFTTICDRAKLAQVFTALLSLSIERTSKGGEITVEFLRGRDGESSVRISDGSEGVPPEAQQSANPEHYQPGFPHQIHNAPTLDIAGVRDVIGLHGGRLFITSKAGEGSTFLFSLPAVHLDSEEKSHDEQAVHTSRRR